MERNSRRRPVVSVFPDGPLVVGGGAVLVTADGESTELGPVALCRCGRSQRKPFCDASHRTAAVIERD